MASNVVEKENSDRELKRLDFVRMIAINAAVCVSNLYEYAKRNSGPLKSTVGTVENAVNTVVGPVYEKFNGVPDDFLVFFDEMVYEATNKIIERAPPLTKKVAYQTSSVIQKVLQAAQNLAWEAKVGGPFAAIHYAGTMSKQFIFSHLAMAWYEVHRYPPLHLVAQMAVPTAVHWSEKYNKVVADMTAKGFTAFNYIPLVPIDEMAKAYKQVAAAADQKVDSTTSSSESETETD